MLDLKKVVDWAKVFGVIKSVDTLKRNQTRPLRTEIVELSIDKYSGGNLKYVGNTVNGMDFKGTDGLRYECKMQGKIFQPTKPWTNKITLKNHRTTKKNKVKKTFDKIIFIDCGKAKVGVADFEDLTIYNLDAEVRCRVEDQDNITIVADGVDPHESYDGVDMGKVIFEAIRENLK
jgi:hypothetical protein